MLKRNTFFLLIIGSFFIFHNTFGATIIASNSVPSDYTDPSYSSYWFAYPPIYLSALQRINFTADTVLDNYSVQALKRNDGTVTGNLHIYLYDSDGSTILATSTNAVDVTTLPIYTIPLPATTTAEWLFSPYTLVGGHKYYIGPKNISNTEVSGPIRGSARCGAGIFSPATGYTGGVINQYFANCGGTTYSDYTNMNTGFSINSAPPPPSITPTGPTSTIANNPVVFSGTFFDSGPFWPSAFKINLESHGINNDGIGGYSTSMTFTVNQSDFLLGTYSHAESLSAGYYTYNLSLINIFFDTVSTTTNNINFRLTSSAIATSTSATSTIPIIQPVATTTCSTWYLMGCVQNALISVFVPNLDIQRVNWQEFSDSISKKPPFGWIGMLSSAMGIIIAGTTTPAFTTIDLSALDPYLFNPLKLGMTIILWIGLLIHLYKRIKHIEL